uniref:CCHC-type domain-containing protein n=1 Tax=Tanacetum cinerariifolium TaxID=118510 RepID=A0A699H9T4_TANCI|nr:hypothetical protein [Tanacetum cinerariifolium]
MITVTIGEGEQQTQVTREKIDEEFTEAENNKEHADIQKQFPPTNDKLKTYTNLMTQVTIQAGQITTESVQRRAPGNKGKHVATGSQGKVVTCYNCRSQGHVAKECKEKKRAKDSQWFKDKALLMEAKEKGVIMDAEAEAFLAYVECTTLYAEPLAITTTRAFEVRHEDAYDSDVDEAPHGAASFMANMIQTVSQEIHGGEQLHSNVDSIIDDHDNTILYHQYQLNNEVKSGLIDVSSVVPGGISMITILDNLRIKNDSLRDENVSIKKRYQDLYQSKAESKSNVSSGAVVPEKPKVLAPNLYDMTPRITKPEVVPLEKSKSVSTSKPANNVIVTPRFYKKPLTSYKRKDRKLKDISTRSPPNAETKAVNDPVNGNDLSANQLDPNKN